MVAEDVSLLMEEGLTDPIAVMARLEASGRYITQLTPEFVARQMRLLTKDTTVLARQIAKARAARTMLEVLETGDTKDKIAVLRGTQVLGDVVDVKVDQVTRHVVELHEGPPPKPE